MVAPLNSNHPLVPAMEEARQGIQTFAMFYYQSLLDAGFQSNDAKRYVADLLEQQYYFFCESGQMTPKTLGTVEKKLERVLEQVKQLAMANPALRSVYNELLSIQAQLNKR